MQKSKSSLIILYFITVAWGLAVLIYLLYPLFKYVDTSFIFVPSPFNCIGLVLTLVGLIISIAGLVSFFRSFKRKSPSRTGLIPVLLLICFIAGWSTLEKYNWKTMDRIDKDAVMIENFYKHRGDFEKMVEMIKADAGLERVDYNWTRPEDIEEIGITAKRISEYRRLFVKTNVPRGFYATDQRNAIEFMAGSQGLSVTGLSKGYTYFESPPKLIVENLDTYWSENGRSFIAYRHIKGNWYLYLDYED